MLGTLKWQPLEASDDGYWLKDNYGHTLTFGGYNAIARDYARLGEMYRLNGKFNGKQIVLSAWIKDTLTPDAPYLMSGKRNNSDSTMGMATSGGCRRGRNMTSLPSASSTSSSTSARTSKP